jgi:hypothetical protein
MQMRYLLANEIAKRLHKTEDRGSWRRMNEIFFLDEPIHEWCFICRDSAMLIELRSDGFAFVKEVPYGATLEDNMAEFDKIRNDLLIELFNMTKELSHD